MVPLSTLVDDARRARSRVHHALQPLPRRRDHGLGGAGLQLRRRARRARGGGARDAAPGDGVRLERDVLPGEGRGRRRGRVRARRADGVPDPGRPVRELVAAVQRAARHAARGVRRLPRPPDARLRAQRVRPDRPRHADRSRGQERHPDRRVRQARARVGQAARRGGAERRAAAPAPDPDDVVRVHPRLRAALARDGRRRGLAPAARHRGDHGDAGRDLDRDLPRAGALRGDRAADDGAHTEHAAAPPAAAAAPAAGGGE